LTVVAREISAAMPGDLHVVGVLTGAFVFLADLVRELDRPLTVDFIRASSYGNGTSSQGAVWLAKGLSASVHGRQVLLVDDIVDTGRTLAALQRHVLEGSPARLRTVCLFDKPSRRQVPVTVEHVGFQIENQFVVGYGLDSAGLYRHLRYVGVLSDETAAPTEEPGGADSRRFASS
jgi:hypoxanthine phosphoribosyltransferase